MAGTDIWSFDDADRHFMGVAMAEARLAEAHGDVPVGAVMVRGGEIVANRHNEREYGADPTAHAEVLAIVDTARKLGTWRLSDCVLYVTLEPCLMCAGAVLNARIPRVVYGAADEAAGAALSMYNVFDDPRLNHRVDLTVGVEADGCSALLTNFFESLR